MTWTYTEETGKDVDPEHGRRLPGRDRPHRRAAGLRLGRDEQELPPARPLGLAARRRPGAGAALPIIANIDELQSTSTRCSARKSSRRCSTPASSRMGQVDGKQIALPWIGGTIGMVANQEVLDEGRRDRDADDRRRVQGEALVKVRDNVPNSVPLGMATKNNASILLDYLTWVWTFGGDVHRRRQAGGQLARGGGGAAIHGRPDQGPPRRARDRPARRPAPVRPGRDRVLHRRRRWRAAFARQFSGRGEEIDAAVKPIKAPVLKEGDTPRLDPVGPRPRALRGRQRQPRQPGGAVADVPSLATTSSSTTPPARACCRRRNPASPRIPSQSEPVPCRLGGRHGRTAAQHHRGARKRRAGPGHNRRGGPGRGPRPEDRTGRRRRHAGPARSRDAIAHPAARPADGGRAAPAPARSLERTLS